MDSMEVMLPKSLGVSDSEIKGVRDVMVNSEEMNAGLRPAFISKEFTIDTL